MDMAFKVLYVVGLVLLLLIRAQYAQKSVATRIALDRKAGLDTLLTNLASLGALLPLLGLLTARLDFADYSLPTWARWLGGVILTLSLWLLWRSHVDLGSNWWQTLEIREGQRLVTEGVYRYIRHPMYAANWLWAMAQALLIANWIAGLGALALLLPWYGQRVRREEEMMLERFGGEYRSYLARTGRILPHITR